MIDMPNVNIEDEKQRRYEQQRQLVLERIKNDFPSKQSSEHGGIVTTILDEHVPTVKELVDSALDTGSNISSVVASSVHAAQVVSSGFQIGSLGLAALNSVRIPALYLLGWLAGEKPPVTLSNNARWAYSSLLLGLSILAIAVPVTAAPIAMTLSTFGLGVSVFALGSFFYKRYHLPKTLKAINDKLITAKNELGPLLAKLEKAENASDDNIQTLRQAQLHLDNLKKLTDQKNKTEKALKAHGIGAFVDRSVGVGLSAMAMFGIALSLFFPTAGLIVLAVASGLGGLYIAAKVSIKIGSLLGKYVKKWKESKAESAHEAQTEQSPALIKSGQKSQFSGLFLKQIKNEKDKDKDKDKEVVEDETNHPEKTDPSKPGSEDEKPEISKGYTDEPEESANNLTNHL